MIPTRKHVAWFLALLAGLPAVAGGWALVGLPVPATREGVQAAEAKSLERLEDRSAQLSAQIDSVGYELRQDLAVTDRLARGTAIAFWQATLTDRLRDVVDIRSDMDAFQRRGETVPPFYRDLEQSLLEDVRRARQKLRELGVDP